MDILIRAGRSWVVAQRFRWPGISNGKGFMLTAYPHPELAQRHVGVLDAGEGKVLDLKAVANMKKLKDLCHPDSGYQFFYSATRDRDARRKLVKTYAEKVQKYSKEHYRGNFAFDIRVEAGQLYGTYSYEKQTIGVLFYDIIK
ncbi:hypothetical protein [Chitinophaga rhizophila]|uniref:Uncharacterized protein n=1 Tax=Chitinophaga rhizophila TaxID=2866212 RepID=A0ABS7G5X1_9BACT|nr:hypothetical protein [Chitinophaga rhizophila]MBW8683048.1 hypothetical protein [Chitinophaga rhizophila]